MALLAGGAATLLHECATLKISAYNARIPGPPTSRHDPHLSRSSFFRRARKDCHAEDPDLAGHLDLNPLHESW
jgi:hypothetical protein